MQKFSRIVVVAALSLLWSPSWADELDEAREAIMARFNDIKAENIQPSLIDGLYRVAMPPQIFYMSGDGRYVVDGSIIDLEDRRNTTNTHRQDAVKAAIAALGEDSMITFGPKDAAHTVTVFTDIDCGYCRKLHQSIADYNKQGIRIRYLSYPRTGLKSASYNKAVSVWCSEDRRQALTDAKQGKPVSSKECDNPVAAHYQLGQRMGISGTPAIVLESGEVIPGYVPPQRLAKMLNGKMPN